MPTPSPLNSNDPHDRDLLALVGPGNRRNPAPQSRYNLVVIGGGTAGIVAAVSAAELGGKVALVEENLLGGSNLLCGSTPLSALIRSAQAAYSSKHSAPFGVRTDGVTADFPAVMQRVRAIRAQLASESSLESLQQKGVDVFFGTGRFVDAANVEVAGQKLNFARAIIATGTRPYIPKIPGLEEAAPLTNETLFSLTELPAGLAIIGAGVFGAEVAQAFARLGSRVTLYEQHNRILPSEDPEAAAVIHESLVADGVTIILNSRSLNVSRENAATTITCEQNGQTLSNSFTHVLLAAGRKPNFNHLQLDKAGIEVNESGIEVTDQLRTTNAHVFACGDVVSDLKSPHAAEALAHIAVGNSLFFGSHRVSDLNIPHIVRTSPGLARTGVHSLSNEFKDYSVIQIALAEQETTLINGTPRGFIKILHDKRGAIHGATVVADGASELIGEIVTAMNHKVTLSQLSNTIHPSQTLSVLLKKSGDRYRRTLLTPSVSKLLHNILKWRR